ncbi:MAG TPA: RecQ family ATP-dependent DNA helicase [Burkholderiaceae bacterium]|nr:RecQ family ATP-dependent DNA helicase [Burkholderiaceae bacterium]
MTSEPFAPRCLSVDLEVGLRDGRIHRFAAIRADTQESLVFDGGNLAQALARLDALADGAAFLLGHNLIAFDLPHLAAAQPDLRLLGLPAVDTLRINPLAFPRNPYHRLVKHYQDGHLKRAQRNDPLLDARLALDVFRDQSAALAALRESAPDLLLAWHWLTTIDTGPSGLNALFLTLREALRPADAQAHAAIERLLADRACATHGRALAADAARYGWPLAYALAWLSVAGGNSVMPPWVRHQFSEAAVLVRRLRDEPCGDPACAWCRERHDAQRELTRWFGLADFRPEPADSEGRSFQRLIVEAALRGRHALGILPTGTGKSLCYQVPALSRYDKTGALTIVISPLVALMADQVAGLEARGITCCAALNGLLSMPERADVLARVRLGGVGILIVSPEQLRNKGFRTAIAQREIGAWVLDEAHCLSKWGHDFRPDYRYVARFIREKAGADPMPPVLCLTATAKPDVVADIVGHFRDRVGIALDVFDGGARRTNLDFDVVPTSSAEKFAHIDQVLRANLPPENPGGAIVYCATRKNTEEVARFLADKGLAVACFHAGLPPERKKEVQQTFIAGALRVIVATNAFGMGIDKPDVRLVIHADIPGSLENYLQEAGRAGRDQEAAHCVLLYTPDDVERQFGMSARSRLTQTEIHSILRALRRLDAKKHLSGEVVATAGEILAEDEDGKFVRDSATDDTRVRTAVSWLEEAALVTREENQVQIFPSSLRVASLAEAQTKLERIYLLDRYRHQLLSIVDALLGAPPDDGITTDELMGVSGLNAEGVRKALHDLEAFGIASNDTALTAFVHAGVERSSRKRVEETAALESALIEQLREAAPDQAIGEPALLHLRHATQRLKDAGHAQALPEKLLRLVRSLANDGRGEEGSGGSLTLRRVDPETVQITLLRDWRQLDKTARLRRAGAQRLLEHLLACLPAGQRGTDLLAETTLGRLHAALLQDLALKAEVRDPAKLLDRALLWLHEQEVIRLNKGLAVFRPAMTIRLAPEKRSFAKADFQPLALHYDEQVLQIHVMAEYAQRGLRAVAEAVQLALDYFSHKQEDFLRRWLPGREKELALQTTPASWRLIVEELNNPAQQRIVADERERTNVLVLAGPGSGKTRVLVHRIAYLVRVKREDPRGILALAYNRHAAVEIRRRLAALIGDDAQGVTVLTCHALAMRLAGVSFVDRATQPSNEVFAQVLRDAVALLEGTGLAPEEADEQRERLLAGFRWILVDEYQDIGPGQYALISVLAGRTQRDEDGKLSLFAVGDDDQNIYAFSGASVAFIRRFADDYAAKAAFLTENYRSTAHIIAAANAVIAPAAERMKHAHPIVIDRARAKAKPGGRWEELDPVSGGRVQLLPAGRDAQTQAVAVMQELLRLAALAPDWAWARAAVIAREWKYLDPVRSFCELNSVPVQMASEATPHFWRLRETQQLVAWLRARATRLVTAGEVGAWLAAQPGGPWWDALRAAVAAYALETGGVELPADHVTEWLAEWGREMRQRQTGLLLLTAHRAKGLEFDHVAVLDGGWDRREDDADAPRRLYYVAMTRARETLALARMRERHVFLDALAQHSSCLTRAPTELPSPAPELARRYRQLTPGEVDLGFAGRCPPEHPLHRAIGALAPGGALALRRVGERLALFDAAGIYVGRLASAFEPPAGMACVEARVAAIVVRLRTDSEPEFMHLALCERWEVVLPELVFAPCAPPPRSEAV